ncbi:hypothetical protein KCU88_g5741, partial [Aureobasidium melanogenum]
MLLSVAPPNPMHNDFKPPHDYPTYTKPNPSRYSPPESPRNLPSFFEDSKMNNSHRGLPLPAGLSLPAPERGHPSAPLPLGHLPAPPSQWAGQDESMRSWLHAKAEEDRRKQEEEKTRQETLRLDRRRIEQSMLRDSLQGGVPPAMVPLIFAGIGGGSLPGQALEWAQQYLASLSIQNQQQQQQIQSQQQQMQFQQQQQQLSPDIHRDTTSRMIPPNPSRRCVWATPFHFASTIEHYRLHCKSDNKPSQQTANGADAAADDFIRAVVRTWPVFPSLDASKPDWGRKPTSHTIGEKQPRLAILPKCRVTPTVGLPKFAQKAQNNRRPEHAHAPDFSEV